MTNRSIFAALRGRMLVLWLVCILLLAACGGSNDAGESDAGKASATAPAEQEQAEWRTVQDAMGDTKLPSRPERIIVLNTQALESLLAFGVKPIGAPYSIPQNAAFFAHLKEQTDGIQNIGTVDEPNLETIAKLNPDLIIAQKEDHEAVYEELKRIAPVYLLSAAPPEWKKAVHAFADAVNKNEEAAALLADYDARVAEFKSKMGDRLSGQTVTLIRPRADHVRIQLPGSFSGAVVAEAGLQRPGGHQTSLDNNIKVTEEQIGEMDADVIISFGREHEAEYFAEKIVKNPLWATLKAVQNDEVHFVNWEVWLSGQGIQSAGIILDDLNELFLK